MRNFTMTSMTSLSEPVRRGEYLAYDAKDTTRVAHPKTADVVDLGGRYLVVPVHPQNPIRLCDTMSEAVSFIERYLGAGE